MRTQAPAKNDLVVGHRVVILLGSGLPVLYGEVAAVSKTGHEVWVKPGDFLAKLAGIGNTAFTWRASASAYQQKGQATKAGLGLVLIKGPRPSIKKTKGRAS